MIDTADAVWLTGGRQYYCAKTFIGTETEKALWSLFNNDLFEIFAANSVEFNDKKLKPKNLLGIGIDESTAIIVRQDRFEVVGGQNVFVFDPQKWTKGKKPYYDTLSNGDNYDIRKRKLKRRKAKRNDIKGSSLCG